jgi:hypothetical protein
MPLVPHVAPNTTITSPWGNLVADHVVMRFASAAERTAQLTAPILNQLTSLDTAPGVVEYWNGTAWAKLTPAGAAVTYTPAWIPGGSLGTGGTITGRYTMVSPFHMYLQLALVLGTSPSLSAGIVGFGLPAGFTAQTAQEQYGSGVLNYFGRGAFHAELSARSTDGSRIFVAVPRGATPGTTDGSVAAILADISNTAPTGWVLAGSFIRGSILVEVVQRW